MDNASPTTENPTPPSGGGQPTTGPRVSRDEMKDLGRLRRSVTDRHIAGVAGGIARHLDVDAIIVRVALVVGVFFGGAGLLLYIGAWLLVPEEGTDDEPLGLDQRSRSLALAGVGVLALICAVGDWAGAFGFPWQLAIVAAIVVLFLHRRERGSSRRTGYGYAEPATETAYGPATETSYAAPTYGPPAEPQHWETYARAPRPRNPRKRGPILFFFTLALIALAEGVLGVVDLAGVDVADGAYPALALGVIAVMLVVGLVLGPGRRADRPRPGGRPRDRRLRRREQHRRRAARLRADQRWRRAGELRVRRRPVHPRPLRRVRRRGARRPRHLHRRGRR